ncbi:MAG: hypothetical protein L0I49_03050 [Lactococcus raffinolactis]|nr:hypothetical protein [Lactococcus lactis]MDN6092648.1 hypothetical protein [Lactococcus raffinolactis]MDN6197695.1 hypothetical protein [Lactococcus raffinolactis]
MNDERIVSQVTHVGKVSGDFLLKALWLLIEKSSSYVAYKNTNKVYVGNTNWNKFLASSGDKDIKTFLTSEVNLDLLKAELERYKLPFSYYEPKAGEVALCFDVRNTKIVETAMQGLLKDLTTDPKALNKRVLQTPKKMKPNEKIRYYKNQKTPDAISKTHFKKTSAVNSRVVKAPTPKARNL